MESRSSNESTRNRPVGFFDSGLGGLTVVREFVARAPAEDVIYLGDTARLPYGTKSARTVLRFSRENAEFLVKKGVKMVVIACSTASSIALTELRNTLEVPVLGVVEAGAGAEIFKRRNFDKIGIIGTVASMRKREYHRLVKELQPQAEIVSRPCPLFVPLVEEGMVSGSIARAVVEHYLSDLKDVQALILGCTHYPLLKPLLREYFGEDTVLIDPSEEAAAQAAAMLERMNIQKTSGQGKVHVYLTDLPPGYETLVERFVGPVPLLIHNAQEEA